MKRSKQILTYPNQITFFFFPLPTPKKMLFDFFFFFKRKCEFLDPHPNVYLPSFHQTQNHFRVVPSVNKGRELPVTHRVSLSCASMLLHGCFPMAGTFFFFCCCCDCCSTRQKCRPGFLKCFTCSSL